MQIGVLGSGSVAQILAARLLELDHDVMIGTRDPAKLAEWVKDNPKAKVGSFAETAAHGNLIINAVSGAGTLNALNMAGEENLSGKILVDVSNPLDYSNGFSLFVSNTDSLGERIQRAFPKTKVVKALNTVNAQVMVYPARVENGDHTLFMSGNDENAKVQVSELLRTFGWVHIIDLGDITAARGMEAYLLLWVSMYNKVNTAVLNVKVQK